MLAIAFPSNEKILMGGNFTSIGGQTRFFLARLDSTTGLADSLNPSPNNSVSAIAIQADGKVLIGGSFTAVGTKTRNYLARLELEPRLTIASSATTNVILSWLTNFPGLTLESSTNLDTDIWTTVSPPPVIRGTNNVVTNTSGGPMRFYRLRQ